MSTGREGETGGMHSGRTLTHGKTQCVCVSERERESVPCMHVHAPVGDVVVVAVAEGAHHLLDQLRRHLLRVVVPFLVVQPAIAQ